MKGKGAILQKMRRNIKRGQKKSGKERKKEETNIYHSKNKKKGKKGDK